MSLTQNNDDMQVLILAAGLGTRLWPLTVKRAKPAIPFLGKALVRHCVELAKSHGLSKIVVNTHHQAESVREALKNLPVTFSHETQILGTAGALRHALDQGALDADRSTLIINGKLFTDVDLRAAMDFHRRHSAQSMSAGRVTMVLRENKKREAFREVLLDGDRVAGFGEGRASTGKSPLLFTGIHIMSPAVLATIPAGQSDSIRDTYPPFIARGEVYGCVDHSPRWWEFSTLKRYIELHAQAFDEKIGPRNTIAPSAQVHETAALENCIVWAGAQIEAHCQLKDLVIGEQVRLGAGSRIEQTVIMRKADLGNIERGRIEGEHVYVPLA